MLAAMAACASRPGWAFGPASKLDVAALRIGSVTEARPNAWARLLHDGVDRLPP